MTAGLMVPAVAITLFTSHCCLCAGSCIARWRRNVVGTASLASVGPPSARSGLPTRNGKTLAGWFVPVSGPGPHPAVAVVHGWGGNAETMLPRRCCMRGLCGAAL